MKVFFDSSAWAKGYVHEPGSDRVLLLCREADDRAIAVICVPEVVSAMNRRRREGILSAGDIATLKGILLTDVQNLTVCDLMPETVARAVRLLESYPLKGMDALHLACALTWGADLFVTADRRQADAADAEGLKVATV